MDHDSITIPTATFSKLLNYKKGNKHSIDSKNESLYQEETYLRPKLDIRQTNVRES